MEGTVKWFDSKKGYGFINGDDGEDYFVHHTFIEGAEVVHDNERVSFDAVQNERGKQAQKVKLIENPAE